ncbi:MAG: class A beta-lactamase [Pseudomonadota bacterium]
MLTHQTVTRLVGLLTLSLFGAPALSQDLTGTPITVAQVLEQRLKNRVGVMVIDTGSGRTWSYRADERFPMASTFKAFACGALLAMDSAGQVDRRATIPVFKRDLVPYAPVLKMLVGGRISLEAACTAATRLSDNAAANIVLRAIGGPVGLTRFMRSIGDKVTRLDRYEVALNTATPGDPRDTTTPRASAKSLQQLLLGKLLPRKQREMLKTWLLGNEVGGPLLRSGVPSNWRIADRTGAGGFGTRSVISVMWPPSEAPYVVAAFLTGRDLPISLRNQAIAAIGRSVARLNAKRD